MESHCQQMQSSTYVCGPLSFAEYTEHDYVKGLAHRNFMDAATAAADAAVTVPRSECCRPALTTDTTSHCTASENTKPRSSGISTKNSKEIQRLGMINRTDANDASIEDIPGNVSSSEDIAPEINILTENNPTRKIPLQDACLETLPSDGVAVDDTSSQTGPVNIASRDNQPLENEFSSKSTREVNETSQKVSCAATETFAQYFSFSVISKSTLYSDAVISNCSDNTKPRSSLDHPISDYETLNQYCNKFNRRRKDRPQRTVRKWRKVPNEMQCNLRTSLFPRTGIIANNSSIDEIKENEMQREFELFQNALQSSKQIVGLDAETNVSCTATAPDVHELFPSREGKETADTEQICGRMDITDTSKNCSVDVSVSNSVPVQKNSSRQDVNKIPDLRKLNSKRLRSKENLKKDIFWLSDDENIENVTFYENKIPLRNGSALESLLGQTNKKLRAKKKWKEIKARIQIKTKYCRSLSNSVHGQTFYIHHRVMKLMPMEVKPREYVTSVSLKRIDKNKGLLRIKEITETSGVVSGHNTRQYAANRSAANTSRFAVDAFNADGDLAAEVVNIMINLQHRDLLPEDYELLLRLDDRVKPKTVDVAILTELKTESVTCECDVLDVCAVCLEPYEVGQTKKFLPCQHYFHENCIDSWLSNSSMNCPLDATPVVLC